MAGILISSKERASKTGQKYAFVQLSDAAGQFEVVMFSEILARYRPILETGKAYLMQLTGRMDGEQLRLTVQNVEPLETIMENQALELTLTSLEKLHKVKGFCQTLLPGKSKLRLKLQLDQGTVTVDSPEGYTLSLEQRAQLMTYAEGV